MVFLPLNLYSKYKAHMGKITCVSFFFTAVKMIIRILRLALGAFGFLIADLASKDI